jgi:hypothetical protein
MYQGSCLVFRWPLSLEAGATATFRMALVVSQTRDHSAEELAAL